MNVILIAAASLWLLAFAPRARADNDALGSANIGERLFLETRFSQFFFTNSHGNANFKLINGDPVMDMTASIYGPFPGPFAGQAMNCRACHLVEEHESFENRTYADFAARSPIPSLGNGAAFTPRNAIDLVDSLLPHPGPLFLHYDGQFATPQDLIIATFTGRNFGWKPAEYGTAISQIVHVIRNDDGGGDLAQQYGGWPYANAFAGLEQIQPQYRVDRAYRLYDVTVTNEADPNYVTDSQIVVDIAALIQSYLETLVFSQDTNGLFNGSPYDIFLIKNGLPRQPAPGEPPIQYARRLLQLVNSLGDPQFVTDPADGHLTTHNQVFQFGANELAGLKIFLTEPGAPPATLPPPPPPSPANRPAAGNCVVCHTPPAFTDFLFHNTGAAQEEYDAIHGGGSFLNLVVPSPGVRAANYDAYLPATTNHPNASGAFITPPSLDQPGVVDLGLWNVFDNPDFPAPQPGLQQILPRLLSVPPPQITSASVLGGHFIFAGTNGPPGWPYYVWSATNLSFAAANWAVVASNVFGPDGGFTVTNPAPAGQSLFYRVSVGDPSADLALPRLIAFFKTPNVRDLASSEPYLHTGRMDTIEEVISFYQNSSALARAGALRNAAPELSGIFLDNTTVAPLAAFLRSLDEDYVDIPCPCL